MQLSAQTLRQMCKDSELITPFIEKTLHKETNLSGGLTSAGYDVHINEFSIPTYQGKPISEFPLISAWDHRQKELDAHQRISSASSLQIEILEKDVQSFEKQRDEISSKVYTVLEGEKEEDYEIRVKPLLEKDNVEIQNFNSQIILIKNKIEELENGLIENSKTLNTLLREKEQKQDIYVLQPNAIILGSTLERFKIPRNLSMAYYNKSTLARRFISSDATLGEPAWEGYLTLEIKNNSHVPVTLYKGQPIGQVVFNKTDKPTDLPYDGKYQNQNSTPQGAI
jgi:deoxycytidine triphosphate deaminase